MSWSKYIGLLCLAIPLGSAPLRAQPVERTPRCIDGQQEDRNGCPCECPKIYRPVCGVDRVTYANDCLACPIEILHQGVCGEEPALQPPAEESAASDTSSPLPDRPDDDQTSPTEPLPSPRMVAGSPIGSGCPLLDPAAGARLWYSRQDRGSPDLPLSGTLADWIAVNPGVDVIRHGRPTSTYSLRGLTGRRTLVVWDGVRLNTSGMADGIDSGQGLFDLSGLSQVEVHLGPRSGLFGSDAMGGVIALSSLAPSLAEDGFQGSIQARFASAELERSGSARAEGRTGPVALLGGVSAQQTSELRAGDPYGEQDRPGYTQLSGDVLAALDTAVGELSIRYGGLYQVDLHEPLLPWAQESPEIRQRGRDFAWAGFHHEDPEGWLAESDVRLAYVRHSQDTREWDGSDGHSTVHQFSLSSRCLTPVGSSVWMRWGAGLDLEQISLGGTQPVVPDSAELTDGSRHLGLAALAVADILITEQLLVELEARAGWTRLTVPRVGDVPGSALWEIPVNGGLALRYLVTPALSIHFGASNGTRYPNLRDLYTVRRRTDGTILGNEDLSGEQVIGLDLGLSLRYERLSLRLVGFHSFLFDLMSVQPTGEFDPDNLDPSGSPLPYLRQINLGEARIGGVEAQAEVELGDMVLYASVSWAWGQDTTGDHPLWGIAPMNGLFGVSYRGDRWGVGPRCRFALEQTRTAPGEPETPGYALFGLMGYLWLGDWGRVVASVDNLADEGYRTHGSSFPEPGINATVSVQAELH